MFFLNNNNNTHEGSTVIYCKQYVTSNLFTVAIQQNLANTQITNIVQNLNYIG